MRIRLCRPGIAPRCLRACLGGAFLLSFTLVLQARLAPIPRLPILAVWSFSRSLSLFLSSSFVVGSRSATSYLSTALLSARGLHHCIRRLSCCLLEVGLRYFLDLTASHRLGHLCLPLHLWSHCSFLRDFDLFLKLFYITSTRSFLGVRISSRTFLMYNLRCKFRPVFAVKPRFLRATERQCLVPKAVSQSCCLPD